MEQVLKGFSGRTIQIVTAFAGGTENLVDALLEQGNHLEIIIGTINAFSSPKLIEHCKNQTNENLVAYVDFRYEASNHWKLYLIEPSIVIIGSANFTNTGVSLERDIMTVIKNTALYNEFGSKIEDLKSASSVINVADTKSFNKYFAVYLRKHRDMQKALAKAANHKSVSGWLNDEANQTLPLFIWDANHSKETIKKAHELVEQSDLEITRDDIKDFFTYACGENEIPYEDGDIVLSASHKGSYIQFQSFDRIIYDNGTHYIYSFKKKRYKYPFKLDEIKQQLKQTIPIWYDNGVTEIHRSDISALMG